MMSIRSPRRRRPASTSWPVLVLLVLLAAASASAAAATPRHLLDEPLLESVPDPRGNGRLYAVTLDHRLLRSVDGGESWQEIGTEGGGLPAAGVEDLEIDPLQPGVLYAVPSTGGTPFYRSTDGGDTWQPAGDLSSQFDQVSVAEAPAGEVTLVGAGGDRLFRSADRGETWRPVAPGFAPEQLRDISFVEGAAGPAILFAAGRGGLWALEVAPPVPDGPSFTDPVLAGFRVWVRISAGDGEALPVRAEAACIPETLCVSGSLPGRSEVFVRIVGPKPNGNLWPTLVKFTTSRVEVWIEQLSTGEVQYYDLPGATPGVDELDGLFDRDGFEP